MKFNEDDVFQIWKIISSILHLGELESSLDEDILQKITLLLDIPHELLHDILTVKYIKTPGETYKKKLEEREILQMRDTLIKCIYGEIFNYLVYNINKNMSRKGNVSSFIGILDIFGFEVFQHNYFEQLCINYTNEILQEQFNKYIFKLEQEEYSREEINWNMIHYPDNSNTIKLISGKPVSLFTLLDQEITVAKGDDNSYVNKIHKHFKGHECFKMSSKMRVDGLFSINHYAGKVIIHNTLGFCYKNKDTLREEIFELFKQSKLPILNKIYKRGLKIKRKGSISKVFCKSLSSLVKVISKTDTHYIRCIKPNEQGKPDCYERNKVVLQLRYAGVLEAIKVSRAGYPIRILHAPFFDKYKILGVANDINSLFVELGSDDDSYQVGKTKVFLRRDEYYRIEGLRNKKCRGCTDKISSHFRRYKTRKWYLSIRTKIIRIQSLTRMYNARLRLFRLRACRRLVLWWRQVWRLKKTNSAKKIQGYYRRYATRQKYIYFRKRVIIIQRFIRLYKRRFLF